MEKIDEVIELCLAVKEAERKRDEFISENKDMFLSLILEKMNWNKEEIYHFSCNYSWLHKRIMMSVTLKSNKSERYVFDFGKNKKITLNFREDMKF